MAQNEADTCLIQARSGIDETEESVARKLSLIKDGLKHGLSPEQIAHIQEDELGLSRSTIYRWIDAGYAGMTNLELRKRVGYKPRQHVCPRKHTRHDKRRSYASFLAQGEELCASAWEMDTVMGSKLDSVCLLTLLHRPSRFQLALPLASCDAQEVICAIERIGEVIGHENMASIFQCVLTDNGSEFADDISIAQAFGESVGHTTLFFCDPRQSQQKGACEKNHVELRKLLPKGEGIRFDRLDRSDCSVLMSQVNSEPRGCLAWMSPIKAFQAAFGEIALSLLDAFGIEEIAPDNLNLTRSCIEEARLERGEVPLS
jgi:IS30 family transposase